MTRKSYVRLVIVLALVYLIQVWHRDSALAKRDLVRDDARARYLRHLQRRHICSSHEHRLTMHYNSLDRTVGLCTALHDLASILRKVACAVPLRRYSLSYLAIDESRARRLGVTRLCPEGT